MSRLTSIAASALLVLGADAASAQKPTQAPARNRPLVAMIDRYLRDPLNIDLGGAVMDSGDARHEVTMVLASEVMPWTCYADTNATLKALDQVLSVAYVAGNMRAQLTADTNANDPRAGVAAVLQVYPLLKMKFPRYVVPEVEHWFSTPPAARNALADSLARHPTECPNQAPRYRQAVSP